MLPNSGLAVHVLSDGVILLWAQVKRALLVISENTHNFVFAQQPKLDVGFLIVEVYRSHTIRHTHTHGKTALYERSARTEAATYTTHKKHKRQTNIHAFSGI